MGGEVGQGRMQGDGEVRRRERGGGQVGIVDPHPSPAPTPVDLRRPASLPPSASCDTALFLFVPGRLQVNLVGAMRVTQAFLPLLRKGAAPRLPVPCSHFHTPLLLFLSSCAHSGSSPGRIINMSSQVGGGQQGATS